MGGGMGEMMKDMGVPPPKELYPALMALPELTPEQRLVVEQQSGERMHAGAMLIGQALDTLNAGTQVGDYAAMHEAMTRLREGTAQLESGIAARRALAEGRLPREVAMTWFKREMNLSSASTSAPHQPFGVTPFHLFTMVLLVVFALAMVAMYFVKMRRAAALFGRIEADKKSPPPGSAPELTGGKPPNGERPTTGGKPASADKPAAPADKPAAPVKPVADAPPKGNGPAPSAPAQEGPAATKFACLAPAARAVFLVGTFNGWDAKATPMIKDAEGNWEVAVALPPGRHEFKFVVDGALCCEPGCEGPHQGCPKCVPNESGTMNRFIEVT